MNVIPRTSYFRSTIFTPGRVLMEDLSFRVVSCPRIEELFLTHRSFEAVGPYRGVVEYLHR